MKKIIMFLVLGMPSLASADMYKCISPKGGVIYSDSPCAANNRSSTKLPIENNHEPIQRRGKPSWEIDSDRIVMNHIRMGELDVAERLAVTAHQKNMVLKAKYLKDRGTAAWNPETFQQNSVDKGLNSTNSANRDFDVQMKAKRDYQNQQIPGFITHQPTDPQEVGVYKQEMNRQKNIDPNTWNSLIR